MIRSILSAAAQRTDPDTVTEPDPELVETAIRVIDGLARIYRPTVTGLHHIPDGPALLVGNHNGGITFLEPFFLGAEVYRERGEVLRALGHDFIVGLPGLGGVFTRLGAVRASHTTADAVFAAGHKVAVWPGGNWEAFRPWSERYRVDFGGHRGFVRLALRHGVPIVPVLSTAAGHSSLFVLRRGERLARWTGAKRFLRSDSFPVFVALPWGIGVGPVFHLPLPVKMEVVVGEPMVIQGDPTDAARVSELRDQVQARLQEMMDASRR